MARESACLTDIFSPNKGSYGVHKGEFLGLKHPCLQDSDRQQWTEGGLWGGSRREYQPEKLADDWVAVTLSFHAYRNVSRPLGQQKNEHDLDAQDQLHDGMIVLVVLAELRSRTVTARTLRGN